ncbi:Uncharacterized protein HZ326_3081 [Fusarium oxysporum f. sp. albedinis]|nr:Uncharacterized protein HZ326_3081 [Fusarium oxysporum f. sp. albedinis]
MSGPVRIGQTGNWVTKSKRQGQAFHPVKLPAVCHGFLHTKSGTNQILAHLVDERSNIQDGMVASRSDLDCSGRALFQGCWGAASAELSHHQPLDGSTIPVIINVSRLRVPSCARETISNGLEGIPGVAAARINETADNP